MTYAPTILITGATDGLGRALAEHLAADGAYLILHGRDPARLQVAADLTTPHSLGRPPLTVLADFADLRQVHGLADDLAHSIDHLDILVNNAGIGAARDDHRETSADGHELRFAVNYLAGFDLTLRLLPLLRAAGGGARIVNVASLGQHPVDFNDVMIEHNYSGTRAYGQSKLAQITAGFTLAERLPADQITDNSLHPATYMPTKIVHESVGHTVDTLEEAKPRPTDSPPTQFSTASPAASTTAPAKHMPTRAPTTQPFSNASGNSASTSLAHPTRGDTVPIRTISGTSVR